jgi:predicted GH43/DUF377 family glycosyl hydrolase
MKLFRLSIFITIFVMALTSCSKDETIGSLSATVNKLKVTAAPNWYSDGRCFLRGYSGAFDGIAVKDPSIVTSGGKYHMFYTGKDASSWRMGYASATTIAGLKTATHVYMGSLNAGSYFCAPQVFYFHSKGKWFLIYQSNGACYSTNSDISNPSGWSAMKQMFSSSGLDFWCISDGTNVYCFYGPNDGSHTIKRRSTTVANFPNGWGAISTVCSNTFEAPHVYKNNADGKYYMMVEDVSRHFELWTATSLGGTWTQVNENWAIASRLTQYNEHWTDQVSHGEIIRTNGCGEMMEVDNIDHCQVLIQGVTSAKSSGVDYGQIPYELGLIRNYQ